MKLLLFGKDGQVGWELQRALATVGDVISSDQGELDFECPDELRQWVRRHAPDLVVNAAAYTAVDQAESEPERARRINADSVGVLAEEAARLGAWLVHYSTDYIFDGEKPAPYDEDDPAGPLSVYGQTKWEGEERIRAAHSRHLIFRTSWVYAARGKNFIRTIFRLAQERDRLDVVADQHGAPTSAELIADVTALAVHRLRAHPHPVTLGGTYHLVAGGETTWHGLALAVVEAAQACGVTVKAGPEAIRPIPTEGYPLPARRPRNSRLNTAKLAGAFHVHLPEWRDSVHRAVRELAERGRP